MTDITEPTQTHGNLFLCYDKIFISFDELKEVAAFIFLGHITQQWITYSGPPQKEKTVPWTHSKIAVERVFKRIMTSGEELEILQLGGLATNGIVMMPEEFPLLIAGGRYVLILNESKALIPPQGVYVVNEHNEVNSLISPSVQTRLKLPFSIYQISLDQLIDQLAITS